MERKHERLVFEGAGIAFAATLMTWFIAVHILNGVSQRMSAFAVQAATGLLAIFILSVVMNWFFHKLYGTGWISLHNPTRTRNARKEEEWEACRCPLAEEWRFSVSHHWYRLLVVPR